MPMTPTEFEHFTTALLNLYGYQGIRPIHRVNGRGCTHQIDSIGIKRVTPTFSYPITLVCEAKYFTRQVAVGIGIIRNFYAVIEDIKQKMPAAYIVPTIDNNVYLNGTSNIIGMVIANTGFSERYSKPFAFAHGIKLVTVDFKKEKTYLFGNLSGFTVIIELEFKIEEIGGTEEELINSKRRFILRHIDEDRQELVFFKFPVKGEIRLLEILKYKDSAYPKSRRNDVVEKEVFCFLYEITAGKYLPKMKVISQVEIKKDTFLTIEFPEQEIMFSVSLELIN